MIFLPDRPAITRYIYFLDLDLILLLTCRSVQGADVAGGMQGMKRPGRSPRPLVAVREERLRSGKGFGSVFFRSPKGGSAQMDGDAMVFEAVDHSVYEGFSLEEAVPFGIVKIGCDDCGFFLIA